MCRRKIREISRVSYITELKAASCYRPSQVFRFYSMIKFWRDFRKFIKCDIFLRKRKIAWNALMLNNLRRTWNIEYEIIISLLQEFFSFDNHKLYLKNLRNWEFYNYKKYKFFFFDNARPRYRNTDWILCPSTS